MRLLLLFLSTVLLFPRHVAKQQVVRVLAEPHRVPLNSYSSCFRTMLPFCVGFQSSSMEGCITPLEAHSNAGAGGIAGDSQRSCDCS